MAELDDLVGQVEDPELRRALESAARTLKRQQRFGLVFERHIPEVGILPRFPIQPGDFVRQRTSPDIDVVYRVVSIDGKAAVIKTSDGGDGIECSLDDLLLIKRFGEPIYPTLRPLEVVTRGGDKPHHAVINGENYHALQLLLYLYEAQVDCIYIDPPYNTGARDWKYNNRFVDNNDAWRHSKWLAMMEKRLRLAKRLLKPDGVLIVMIDEHELHHLGMLLETLFPENLHYAVSIVINARGSTGNRNFGSIDEYALFVVPNLGHDVVQPREAFIPDFHPSREAQALEEVLLGKVARAFPDLLEEVRAAGISVDEDETAAWQDLLSSDIPLWNEEKDEEEEEDDGAEEAAAVYWRGAVRTGQGTSFRSQRPRQFYPLFIDPAKPERIEVGEPLLDRDENGNLTPPSWDPVNGLTPIWPVDEEGAERVWCYEPNRMRDEIAKGNIRVGRFNPKRNTYAVNVRRVRRTVQRFRERTIWWEKSYDAGSNGTNILKRLLGESGLFPFPKSVYAVRDVLATVVGPRPDALILDFFAGSGTTLHSTCLLNAIDNGRRRCILVTNNEVDEKTEAELAEIGHFQGDPEFEAMGLFERVAAPRVKAVVTGRRPDGSSVPGKHKWAGGRPFAEGFEENVEFYKLDYLDPDEVDLGLQFGAILPLLWLAAGGVGERPESSGDVPMLIPAGAPFAVLFEEGKAREFAEKLAKRPDITHVFIVTDSPEAFAEMRALAGPGRHVSMLYRDYLRNFVINTRSRL